MTHFVRRGRAALLALPLAVLALALAPGSALAVDCGMDFNDAEGQIWDMNTDGSIGDGSDDAYDSFGRLTIEPQGGIETTFGPTDDTACTLEDGDREIAFPFEANPDFGGLEVSRKTFIPATGLSFMRTLDILRNPTGAPITATIRREGNLGTDSDTIILGTSTGDRRVTGDDAWAAAFDGDDPEETDPALLWDSAAPGKPDKADMVLDLGPQSDGGSPDNPEIVWENVVIPAGGTFVFMHIDHQAYAEDETVAFAQAWGGGADQFYSGISDSERGGLRNWGQQPDADVDGVVNSADNCPTVSNADQANVDGDAQGNVCDDDADNDGLSNTTEANLGLNHLSADTDGDGRGDATDACPRTAGTGSDGCRDFASAGLDLVPPLLDVNVDGAMSPREFANGVTVATNCDGCRVIAVLSGRTRQGDVRLSRARVILAVSRLGLGSGERALKLRPCRGSASRVRSCKRRLVRRLLGAGTVRMRVAVEANDQAGNRTRRFRTITVR